MIIKIMFIQQWKLKPTTEIRIFTKVNDYTTSYKEEIKKALKVFFFFLE